MMKRPPCPSLIALSLSVFQFLSLFVAVSAFADDERPFTQPLTLRNDSPLYLTLFSTALPDRATIVAPRRWAWGLGYSASNSIVDQNNLAVSDRVIVDGEMHRFEVGVKYGLSPRWELGVFVPYLVFNGGYLDGFVDSFEDAFGFTTPRARSIRSAGQLRYLVRVNGQDLIDESDETIHGLADIPFQVKYLFRDREGGILPRASVRGLLKLPTATDPHLGNDRLDGGVGVLAEQPIGRRILLTFNLDVTSAHLPLALKTVDIDPVVVSGMAALEHFLTRRLTWKAQLMAGSNPYPKFDKDMTAVNRAPMGIALGATWRLFPRASIQLAATENINSAWPDFGWTASVTVEQ